MDKPVVSQLVKEFPTFRSNRMFVAGADNSPQLVPGWARWIQSREYVTLAGAMTSYVKKHGGGVNDLPLPHSLIDILMSLFDLINMQIILIDLIIMQSRLD